MACAFCYCSMAGGGWEGGMFASEVGRNIKSNNLLSAQLAPTTNMGYVGLPFHGIPRVPLH